MKMPNFIHLTAIMTFLVVMFSCEKNEEITNLPSAPTRSLIRIGSFEGQNGSSISGQFEIWRNNNSGAESFETLNDFTVINVSETVQFWFTDQTGFSELQVSSNKLLIDSLVSDVSGVHKFSIPAGHSASQFTHTVLFGSKSKTNLAGSKILLPPPPAGEGGN